jgi:hypothetical protein
MRGGPLQSQSQSYMEQGDTKDSKTVGSASTGQPSHTCACGHGGGGCGGGCHGHCWHGRASWLRIAVALLLLLGAFCLGTQVGGHRGYRGDFDHKIRGERWDDRSPGGIYGQFPGGGRMMPMMGTGTPMMGTTTVK